MRSVRLVCAIPLVAAVAACGPVAPRAASTAPPQSAPRVDGAEVPARFELLRTDNAVAATEIVDRRIAPGALSVDARAELRSSRSPAESTYCEALGSHVAAFVRRVGPSVCAAFAPVRAGHVVPPVAWLRAAIFFEGPSGAALDGWYREMSRLLATSGQATGLAVFDDGRGVAVTLSIERADWPSAPLELVVHLRSLPPHAYSVSDHGPVLPHARAVSTDAVDGLTGLTVEAVLADAHCPASPQGESPPAAMPDGGAPDGE